MDRPAPSIWTVDLGNSSAKLVAWELPAARELPVGGARESAIGAAAAARPRVRATLDVRGAASPDALVQRLGELRSDFDCAAVALCSVADADAEGVLERALVEAFGCAVARPDPGLAIACRSVRTIGRDRLFAARGALELVGPSGAEGAIVCDVGTALTVDAVRFEGAGEELRGTFLGGAIAPGPALLMRSLERGGAQLWRVELDPRGPALGAETAEALNAGVVHGLRGAAAELARRVGLESGLAREVRVVCGGAARFLLEPEPFWPGELHHDPDLVGRGLLAALLDGLA